MFPSCRGDVSREIKDVRYIKHGSCENSDPVEATVQSNGNSCELRLMPHDSFMQHFKPGNKHPELGALDGVSARMGLKAKSGRWKNIVHVKPALI